MTRPEHRRTVGPATGDGQGRVGEQGSGNADRMPTGRGCRPVTWTPGGFRRSTLETWMSVAAGSRLDTWTPGACGSRLPARGFRSSWMPAARFAFAGPRAALFPGRG